MQTPEMNVLGHERCLNLRWKGLFLEVDPDAALAQGDHHFWCQHTHICLGPDGQAVGAKECGPSRTCYEAL
jgi:hypothetical protein